jgi:hypothetical protein
VSERDIKARIEEILSDILSDKYEAKITIKFLKDEEIQNGNSNQSRNFRE